MSADSRSLAPHKTHPLTHNSLASTQRDCLNSRRLTHEVTLSHSLRKTLSSAKSHKVALFVWACACVCVCFFRLSFSLCFFAFFFFFSLSLSLSSSSPLSLALASCGLLFAGLLSFYFYFSILWRVCVRFVARSRVRRSSCAGRC